MQWHPPRVNRSLERLRNILWVDNLHSNRASSCLQKPAAMWSPQQFDSFCSSLFRQEPILCTKLGILFRNQCMLFLNQNSFQSQIYLHWPPHFLTTENTIYQQSFLHDELCVCSCLCILLIFHLWSVSCLTSETVGRLKDTGVTLVSVYRLLSNFFLSRKCFLISLIFLTSV